MKQRARHGLWQFHRRARQYREEWWASKEAVDRVNESFYYKRASPLETIVACANRYVRMKNRRIWRVCDYNALIQAISERMGTVSVHTIKAALIYGRERTPIIAKFGRYIPKWHPADISARQTKLSAARKKRIQAESVAHEKARDMTWKSIMDSEAELAIINRSIRAAKAALKKATA